MHFSTIFTTSLLGLAAAAPRSAADPGNDIADKLNLLNSDVQQLTATVQHFNGTNKGVAAIVAGSSKFATDLESASALFQSMPAGTITTSYGQNTVLPLFKTLVANQYILDSALTLAEPAIAARGCSIVDVIVQFIRINADDDNAYNYLVNPLTDLATITAIQNLAFPVINDFGNVFEKYLAARPANCPFPQ